MLALESYEVRFQCGFNELYKTVERKTKPGNNDGPRFHAAVTVDALLTGRKFEDFVHGELVGLGDFAFDGNHPVRSGKVLRILGRIALLSTEFVKIVVVRDVLVGVLFFGSAEGALGQCADFRRGKRV